MKRTLHTGTIGPEGGDMAHVDDKGFLAARQ